MNSPDAQQSPVLSPGQRAGEEWEHHPLLGFPQISSMLPPSQPVVIEMRETQPLLVTITPEKSTVHLFSTAEFWASSPGSAPGSLFVLDVVS